MTPIPLIHNDDLYRVYVDDDHNLVKIELYPDNKNVVAEEVDWHTLDHALQERINNKLLKQYGIKPNTDKSNMHSMRSTNNGRDASAERERLARIEVCAQQLFEETLKPLDTGDFQL